MKIEHLKFTEDETTKTTQSIILVNGVEHVIIGYLETGEQEVFRNNNIVFPALAEKICEAKRAEVTRGFNIMHDWDENEAI